MRIEDPSDLDWYIDNVVVPSGIERRPVGPVLAWQGWWTALANRLRREADDSAFGRAVRLALVQGFVLTPAQLRQCGVSDPAARRLIRRGQLRPCGRGTLTVAATPPATIDGHAAHRREHALRCAGRALSRKGQVVATASATILHGLPIFAVPAAPELIAAWPTTSGRLAAAHVRVPALRPDEVADWFGVPLTTVARTVVDLARFDARSGLMAADAALHEGLLSAADLAQAIGRGAGLHGIRRARRVLQLASERIESPLESITHLALYDEGFPAPDLQVWVRGADGRRYRVDFLLPQHRLIIEADGKGKYADEDKLWDEKRREIALTRAGYRVVRVRWTDVVHNWPAVAGWLRELMAAHPSL
jgi:hypothetical protein